MSAGSRANAESVIDLRAETPVADPGPTVLATWTATVVRALDVHGHDGRAVAQSVGIDPMVFDTEGARIPLTATTALWHETVRLTGDPCFALEVARYVRPSTFHGLSVGVVSSNSFREALDRMVEHSAVVCTPGGEVGVLERDGLLEYTNSWSRGAPAPSHESMEAILACIVGAGRFLHGRSLSPIEVRMQRPLPPDLDRFARFFRCPVRYGCDDDALVYDAAAVTRPLPVGCDSIARSADQVVRTYLEAIMSSSGVTDEVRNVVSALLGQGEPSATTVAASLAMSPRTLQRRLHEEGTTFREVVGEVRLTRARHLLADERCSTELVADRLGFSDVTAFRRSFKRSTGMTPGEFRASSRSAAGSPA